MALCFIALAFCTTLALAGGADFKACHFTTPSGDTYDLSAFGHKEFHAMSSVATLNFKICQDFEPKSECKNCNIHVEFGNNRLPYGSTTLKPTPAVTKPLTNQPSDTTFNVVFNNAENGAVCWDQDKSKDVAWEIVMGFRCDPNVDSPTAISFQPGQRDCQYIIDFGTKRACTPISDGGMSTGGVILLVIFIAAAAYLVLGFALYKFYWKTPGILACIPNVGMWYMLGKYAALGFKVLVNLIARKEVFKTRYTIEPLALGGAGDSESFGNQTDYGTEDV